MRRRSIARFLREHLYLEPLCDRRGRAGVCQRIPLRHRRRGVAAAARRPGFALSGLPGRGGPKSLLLDARRRRGEEGARGREAAARVRRKKRCC